MGGCVSLIGMVNMEAAGGMAMMGAMSTSVPMAEATSEANEKRRQQREEAALRKKSMGSRAQEEERLKNERERKIVQSNYLDDFWDDDEYEGASRKIRYNAKTDTATNFPNKIGFPISLHHGRNHNGALDFRHARASEFSGSAKSEKSKKDTPKSSERRRLSDPETEQRERRRSSAIDLNKPVECGAAPPSYAPRGGPRGGGQQSGYTPSAAVFSMAAQKAKGQMRSASTEGKDMLKSVREDSEPFRFTRERSRSVDDIPGMVKEQSMGWEGRLGGVGGKQIADKLAFLNNPKREGHIKRTAAISAERKMKMI